MNLHSSTFPTDQSLSLLEDLLSNTPRLPATNFPLFSDRLIVFPSVSPFFQIGHSGAFNFYSIDPSPERWELISLPLATRGIPAGSFPSDHPSNARDTFSSARQVSSPLSDVCPIFCHIRCLLVIFMLDSLVTLTPWEILTMQHLPL